MKKYTVYKAFRKEVLDICDNSMVENLLLKEFSIFDVLRGGIPIRTIECSHRYKLISLGKMREDLLNTYSDPDYKKFCIDMLVGEVIIQSIGHSYISAFYELPGKYSPDFLELPVDKHNKKWSLRYYNF